MKTTENEGRGTTADLKEIEEAADLVNLLAMDLALQAFERNIDGDFKEFDDGSITGMVERGLRISGIMGRLIERPVVV